MQLGTFIIITRTISPRLESNVSIVEVSVGSWNFGNDMRIYGIPYFPSDYSDWLDLFDFFVLLFSCFFAIKFP